MFDFFHEIRHFGDSQTTFLMVQQQTIANDQIEQSRYAATDKEQDERLITE
jgi:hypothetical protein